MKISVKNPENKLPLQKEESFYKEYYFAKRAGDPVQFEALLKKAAADPELMVNCYIPELNQQVLSNFYEMSSFSENNENITTERHMRYTPEFSHAHTFFEMIYVKSGVCRNCFAAGEVLEMHAGDICLVAPDTLHSIGVFSDDGIVYNVLIKKSTFQETFYKRLSFDNLLSDFFLRILYTKKTNNYILFPTGDDGLIADVLSQLLERRIYDTFDRILMESLLMTAFCYLLKNHSSRAQLSDTDCRDDRIMEILQYIQRNYKSITLRSAAEHFNYSESHFCKMIKNATGSTFLQHLSKIRFNTACQLLRSTTMSVEEISSAVGMKSPEYFHRFFKKNTALTPRDYRLRFHKNGQ